MRRFPSLQTLLAELTLCARSRLSDWRKGYNILPLSDVGGGAVHSIKGEHLSYKLVTLMRAMHLANNSRHQFKRWFDKEV
jgi:hypothetical protein